MHRRQQVDNLLLIFLDILQLHYSSWILSVCDTDSAPVRHKIILCCSVLLWFSSFFSPVFIWCTVGRVWRDAAAVCIVEVCLSTVCNSNDWYLWRRWKSWQSTLSTLQLLFFEALLYEVLLGSLECLVLISLQSSIQWIKIKMGCSCGNVPMFGKYKRDFFFSVLSVM